MPVAYTETKLKLTEEHKRKLRRELQMLYLSKIGIATVLALWLIYLLWSGDLILLSVLVGISLILTPFFKYQYSHDINQDLYMGQKLVCHGLVSKKRLVTDVGKNSPPEYYSTNY
jgi:hypothetical protein